MDYNEFKKKYMAKNTYFDFSKFKIICKGCGSEKVEFGGHMEEDWRGVYYSDEKPSVKVKVVCKCHDCGQAFSIEDNNPKVIN